MLMSAPMISESDYRSGRGRRRRRTPTRILLVSLPLQNPRSAVAGHGDGGAPVAPATASSDSDQPVAKRTRSRSRASAAGAIAVLPLDLLLWEILLRLPAAALLRCRAVCRSWRRLTSDNPGFLLAHHRRQPSLPLFVLTRSYDRKYPALGPGRGQPLLGLSNHDKGYRTGNFVLHASCDGLLLVSLPNGCFSICNPATRQRAPVPGLNADADAYWTNVEAMYLHRPSGEYRALYWHYRGHKNHTNNEGETLCYILRVPRAREPRHIVLPAAYRGIVHCPNPPVMIRGCLHWDPGRCSLDTAVVFDTEAESFRSMRLPAAAFAGNSRSCTRLHDMDGMLGLSCFDESGTVAEVWVLEGYEREAWSLKYKINFSSESMCSLAKRHRVLSHEGDMLLYSNSKSGSHMVHYEGKFLEKFQWESWASTLTGHLFKESLVKHAFFPKPYSAPTVRHRSLFTKL